MVNFSITDKKDDCIFNHMQNSVNFFENNSFISKMNYCVASAFGVVSLFHKPAAISSRAFNDISLTIVERKEYLKTLLSTLSVASLILDSSKLKYIELSRSFYLHASKLYELVRCQDRYIDFKFILPLIIDVANFSLLFNKSLPIQLLSHLLQLVESSIDVYDHKENKVYCALQTLFILLRLQSIVDVATSLIQTAEMENTSFSKSIKNNVLTHYLYNRIIQRSQGSSSQNRAIYSQNTGNYGQRRGFRGAYSR